MEIYVEFYCSLKKKDDIGWKKNLRRVFGDVPWYYAICLSTRTPYEPEYPFLPDEIVESNYAGSGSGSGGDYRKYGVISRV